MTTGRYATSSQERPQGKEKEMIKLIVFSVLLNVGEIYALLPDSTKIETRKRSGKRNKGRKRGGNGLR